MVYPLLICSRKLWKIAQGLFEEAQCIQEVILNHTCWLLHSTLSLWQANFSFSSVVDLLVYLCEKFGALNQRINETRSSELRLSQIHRLRISVLSITWLSGLSPMLNRASRTIMDISEHTSSVVFASWPCAINQSQYHALDRKFH